MGNPRPGPWKVRFQLKDILPALVMTLAMLVALEILSTTLLPMMGLLRYRIPFNILIVLYLGFKLETPYLPLLILVVQYFHSFFSIEGWAIGTIAGVIICFIISYLREVIHFSTAAVTLFITQIFQIVWFIISASLIYIRTSNGNYLIDKFWRFIPESLLISLIAPFFFKILDRIWQKRESGVLEGSRR